MPIYAAEATSVILAEREDADHIEKLRQQISGILKGLLGPNLWARWYLYTGPVAKIVYYAVTTLSNIQTLGEENNGLIAVANTSNFNLVSFWKRLILVAVLVLQPLSAKTFVSAFLQPYVGDCFATLQSSWSLLSTVIRKLHLAWFYLFGRQYYLIKRLSGVEYISIRPQAYIQASKIFRILGFLTIFRTLQKVVFELANFISNIHKKRIQKKRSNFGKFQCPICLLSRPPACTPCGHIFCWYCILKHCISSLLVNQEAARCPQCREEFTPNRIVPLFNL